MKITAKVTHYTKEKGKPRLKFLSLYHVENSLTNGEQVYSVLEIYSEGGVLLASSIEETYLQGSNKLLYAKFEGNTFCYHFNLERIYHVTDTINI